ncbi:toxic anion resistance protein [Cryobacterium psychrophilum]|uniref:Toxic anion resistance protein n=1 Tax=Cryobacterium psychrophilum TaxID=41988 RepID=A0A4Y8KMU1_9MICO|nr:toxic anion resistance protein [Cryobacterium psychrophilum]TDW31282.1 uncharacterized protein YaaN involved in tellurite resistance [Cryobacterium psychrophilum]TFD78431.1 toxic anion resistance protein [Cryobacterium psychrophilum]
MAMLLAPEDEPGAAPVLVAPEPVAEVAPSAAQQMLAPIPNERLLVIGNQAKGFVSDLTTVNPNSPEFASKLQEVQTLGQSEVTASGAGTNRILERSVTSVSGAKKSGGDATQKVVTSLAQLRTTVGDLTPNAADLTAPQKFMNLFGGKKIRNYFQKYESAQTQLNAIMKSLVAGQDELGKDNATLQQEKQSQWNVMGQLNQYISLAQGIDNELVAQIATLKQAGNVQAASVMETDMLFTVRQRHQDLLTQLAVSIQAYMAMELVRKNNVELIKGVERARTTTFTALQTAITVAAALDNQRLVLDQLDAMKSTTEATILATSALLNQQTARVHEQASSPAISVEVLTKAFDDIFSTLDEVDAFRMKANDSMATSIGQITTQVERAKPQLERARSLEGTTTGDVQGS